MNPVPLLVAITLVLSFFTSPAFTEEPGDDSDKHAIATFAGGCFWCMEPPYDKTEGVISTVSGYMGGHVIKPDYKQVSSGGSGHREVLQVTYDPAVVSYAELLEVYWKNIDPTDDRGQFCDKGNQYTSAIFVHNDEQRRKATESMQNLQNNKPFSGEIYTEILEAKQFYPAEDYHQDYYMKNPLRYKYYRYACGRDKRLDMLWGSS